ncbi:MAG TPA: response regulator transcription factor [Paraburkholderia sp.]|jgi:DNA-binding NarL/FixJ family response regulator|nr:response regulator transcription factor [Paraburkholderia sp.]
MDTAVSAIALKVYLVDAAVEVRRRLARLLGTIAGVEVAGEAEDGDAALEGILACDADIVVLDLRLADGTSLELIQALSRTHPAIVKIVLTNHTARAFRAACEAAGADFFFDKTSELNAACHTVAGIARARGARARE